MTTLYHQPRKCGCCGRKTTILAVSSTNAFGCCDLDARPPEMRRSAMFYDVELCDHCGYAARNLEEPVTQSEELKKILSEKIDPADDVRRFARAAEIAALKGQEKNKVNHLYLIAAWAADDKNDQETAAALRKKILANLPKKGNFTPEQLLQLADIARRAGEKEAALDFLNRFGRYAAEPFLKRIAAYQLKLLARADTACHSVEELQ